MTDPKRQALHYKIRYLADLVWDVAKTQASDDAELSRKLKEISEKLHALAPKWESS
jgi:hypothetical protein